MAGFLEQLDPRKGWKEQYWDPLKRLGGKLYNLDVDVLGEETARGAAGLPSEEEPSLMDVLAPRIQEESLYPIGGPEDQGWSLAEETFGRGFGTEMVREPGEWEYGMPIAPLQPEREQAITYSPEELALLRKTRMAQKPKTITETKKEIKKTVDKVAGKVKKVLTEPPDMGPPTPLRPYTGYPRPEDQLRPGPSEAYGIIPDEQKTPAFWRQFFLGQGTPSRIPYAIPLLLAAASFASPEAAAAMRTPLAIWSKFRSAGIKKKEDQMALLKSVYDKKMILMQQGIPLSKEDRRTLAVIDKTLLLKRKEQVDVSGRYNIKTRTWMSDEEIKEKATPEGDLGETGTWKKEKYEWIMKSKTPEVESILKEKLQRASWARKAERMTKFRKEVGMDVTSDEFKKAMFQLKEFGTWPEAIVVEAGGARVEIDPISKEVISTYWLPDTSPEERMRLQLKYAPLIEAARRAVIAKEGELPKNKIAEYAAVSGRIADTANHRIRILQQQAAAIIQAAKTGLVGGEELAVEYLKAKNLLDEADGVRQEAILTEIALQEEYSKGPTGIQFLKKRREEVRKGKKTVGKPEPGTKGQKGAEDLFGRAGV